MKFLVILTISLLTNLVYGSRILVVVGVPSFSHQKPFQNLAKELSMRGHEVTIMTTNPMKDNSLTNLTEIDISYLYDILRNKGGFENMLSSQNSLQMMIIELRKFFDITAEYIFENKHVQSLYGRKNFDLLLMESHNALLFALAAKFKAPLIGK